MIQRVFSDIDNGFYIDVGACDPIKDSVTYSFYLRGWSGINIEPSEFFHTALSKNRARDVNLRVAISDQEGQSSYIEVVGSGISSLKTDVRNIGKELGFQVKEHKVSTQKLSAITEKYCTGKLVHFLKIDVEGLEHQVIASADWQACRPVLLIVELINNEDTAGMQTQPTWHSMLIEANYHQVWFDGLNRYYLRQESLDLEKHFVVPVNIFDNFHLTKNHGWNASVSPLRSFLGRVLPPFVKAQLRRFSR
jgi:FkbM family methyltransferase